MRQDIEGGFLGYGYVKVGREKILGPSSIHMQHWIPKKYSQMEVDRFWERDLLCGELVDNTSIDYAIDVAVSTGLVKRRSLSKDPDHVSNVEFNKHSAQPLVLVNGYSRIHVAQLMLLKMQETFGEDEIDYMIWVARFYDKGGFC